MQPENRDDSRGGLAWIDLVSGVYQTQMGLLLSWRHGQLIRKIDFALISTEVAPVYLPRD
jgi:hypothetical protein